MATVILRYSAVIGDGETVPPGTRVDLDDAEAEALVARELADYPEPAEPPVVRKKAKPAEAE